MKKIALILIILIVLITSLSIVKDALIKISIQSIVYMSTGLRVDIGGLKTSIPGTFIRISNAVILNPANFDDKIMLDIPEIYIDYDLPAMLRKKIHLNDLRINLREFIVVKNKDARTNLDYIKTFKQKEDVKQKKGSKDSVSPNLQIDNLTIKIGKIIYKDYFQAEEPVVSQYKINIDSRYKNIKNVDEIVRAIVTRALINTAIGGLPDFTKFRSTVSGEVQSTLESTKDVLKKKVDELKDIFKSPF